VDIHTDHVTLHLLTFDEAERILRLRHPDDEPWAPGYPSIEQRDYLQAYLVELRTGRAADNWQAQLRRTTDGLVIGGAGVTGPPDARGSVIAGYEIEPTLPDEGFGAEIVGALLEVARQMGARRVTTSTPLLDPLRQDAYRRCGFAETSRSSGGVHLAVNLD
jgi:RimJ/RimL family protein N-acetyltransferase